MTIIEISFFIMKTPSASELPRPQGEVFCEGVHKYFKIVEKMSPSVNHFRKGKTGLSITPISRKPPKPLDLKRLYIYILRQVKN